MKTSILLIHGAWQGAWVWDEVADLLEQRGFRVRALNLPGSGSDRTSGADVTLASYAEAIVAEAQEMQSEKLVLVGHSMGGAAITAAASLAPELFARLIYVCAFLPRPGESVASLVAEGRAPEGGGAQMEMVDNGGASRLILNSIAETFLNDCTPDVIIKAVPRFGPQPLKPIITPLAWAADFEHLPKDYILCAKDRVVHPEMQVLMAERAGITEIFTLESGHEPFLSMPGELVDLLALRADPDVAKN